MVFNNTMAYTQINTLVLVDTIVIHNRYFYSEMIIICYIVALKIQMENGLKYSDVFT
jgi:hypothetical protein